MDRLAAGALASRETNGGVPYIAAGGRVARDVPPLSCQFQVRKVPVDACSGFRSGCGQPLSALRERPRELKRRARVGRHHGSQTCIGYRGYRCDCLPGLGPGGTPAFDLNDCDDFSWCGREKSSVTAVASHTCLPPSVSVIVTKLAECSVQTATRVNKGVSAVSERVRVFVAI